MKDLIKNKLSQYLAGEISKENLYNWAIDILHQMLKGDIFDIQYLEVWGIVTGLTEVNDIDDSYCDKIIGRFNRVLSGDESASFTFAIQIPRKFVVDNISHIKKTLIKYSVEKQLTRAEVLELQTAVQKTPKLLKTLNELLEWQIVDLIKLSYDFCTEEDSIDFNLKSTLFVSDEVSMSLKDDILNKIITLLECYDGNKCFCVHITFNNGVGNISVQA